MAHKTLAIFERAYAALSRLKNRGESFTDVIVRLTGKTRKGSLLDYVRSLPPDVEFAEALEEIVRSRERIRLRGIRV